jgi:hypothetical protein
MKISIVTFALDENNPYKSLSTSVPFPLSKLPLSHSGLEIYSRCKKYQSQEVQQQQKKDKDRIAVVETLILMNQKTQNNKDAFAPEYRMPPIYGDEQSTNQQLQRQSSSLQTHSSKFPVICGQSNRGKYRKCG